MEKFQLQKLKDWVASDKLKDAIEETKGIVIELDNELYKTVLLISNRFSNWNKREDRGTTPAREERNSITNSLINIINEAEQSINAIIEQAKKLESEEDYHGAIANIEKALVLVEHEDIRKYKLNLIEKLLDKTPASTPKIEKFHFGWVFFATAALISIPPAVLFFKDKKDFDFPFIINIILQISLLMCMVLYLIKPRIVVEDFIQNASDYFRHKFNNRIADLKWFSERANESIKQFGKWWRYLGYSFLALYVLYYLHWIVERVHSGFLSDKFDHFVDVFINGSEGLFLFVLYRILTDNTVRPVKSKEYLFESDLNIQKEIGVASILFFLFIVGSLIFLDTLQLKPYYGIFSLISRTISGTVVAIGICLVIGRLDSKFIEPKKWELILLYSYAAMQLLFPLFDPTLFENVATQIKEEITKSDKETISLYIGDIKMVVLYFFLILKGFFIYYVIKIHQQNELFYYFLLSSKLNDEISKGKNERIEK